ncbi:MAG: tyrosine-type recombinase/integrase [Terriglobales bacterium]
MLAKLGLEGGAHALRHGNATLLDRIGAPMATRQLRLGHVDPATTMGYTHVVSADERAVARNLKEFCTLVNARGRTMGQHRRC